MIMQATRRVSADNGGMSHINTPADSQLGRETAYPDRYDPTLLFPIPRATARAALGIDESALPFIGHDGWNAYELSWLDALGKPHIAVARFQVPANSPHLIESKSLKLYLNSYNSERMDDAASVQARIEHDLSKVAGAPVSMAFGLPPMRDDAAENIDGLEVAIRTYGPPDAELLRANGSEIVSEHLTSDVLKSNCPVTGQPDWATLSIDCTGPRIDREGLLRYLVSYRDHREFHEQCVERIFINLMERCQLQSLSVEARYTRRGGVDINPWRATPDRAAPVPMRALRQ